MIQLMSNLTVLSILAVLNSFLMVYYLVPKISWVIVSRKLIDTPDERSSHTEATPTMAGVAFFITLIMTLFFIQYFDTEHIGLNLIASSTLIFVVGAKDDLIVSTPRAKLGFETLAILFLFFHSAMEETSFDGFLGIYEMPSWFMYLFSVLLILTIINAYNLIDGVDGLASILALVIFSIFALIFRGAHLYFYFLLCLSFIGMLMAYLYYNFSSTKKIFMGDTGSLIIGFCIGFLALRFLTMNNVELSNYAFKPENKLIIIAAIVVVPLFDMLRVIGVRVLNGQSPWFPDRNHTHHILIDKGWCHMKISLVLGLVNYGIVILVIYLSSRLNSFYMLGVLALIFVVILSVFYKLKKQINKKQGLIQSQIKVTQ